MEGVAVPLPPCVQVALAAEAAAAAEVMVLGVGVLPVASRERTSITRCGQVLSTRFAAARTSSMMEGGWVARVVRAICVREGRDAGDEPRKPQSVDVYKCVTLRRKGSPKCIGAGRPR